MAASRATGPRLVTSLVVLLGALAGCLAEGEGRDLPSPRPVVTSESGTTSAGIPDPPGSGSGHDHDLQLLAPAACGGTHLLVSGAGARPRSIEDPERNPALFQRGDTLGFWWLEAEGDQLKAIAYDGDGGVLFVARLSKQALTPT